MSFLNYSACFSTAELKAMRKSNLRKIEVLGQRFEDISNRMNHVISIDYDDSEWFDLRTQQNDIREMVKGLTQELDEIVAALLESKRKPVGTKSMVVA